MTATRRFIPHPHHRLAATSGGRGPQAKLGSCSSCGRPVGFLRSARTGRWYMCAVRETATTRPTAVPWIAHECDPVDVDLKARAAEATDARYATEPVPADPERRDVQRALRFLEDPTARRELPAVGGRGDRRHRPHPQPGPPVRHKHRPVTTTPPPTAGGGTKHPPPLPPARRPRLHPA